MPPNPALPIFFAWTQASEASADLEARLGARSRVIYPSDPVYAGGVKWDGATDDYDAWQSVFAAVNAAGGARIECKPFATSRVRANLSFPANCDVVGNGAMIESTDNTKNVIECVGISNTKLRSLTGRHVVIPGVRNSSCIFYTVGCTDIEIDYPIVKQGAGLGVYIGNSQRVRVRTPFVRDTLADGVHVTNGGGAGMCSKDVKVSNGFSYNTGDDGFATVAYSGAGQLTNEDITFDNITTDSGKTRGFTCAGGTRVRATGVNVRNMTAAATGGIIFILDENFGTFAPVDCSLVGFNIGPAQGPSSNIRHGLRAYRCQGLTIGDGVVNWGAGEGFKVYGSAVGPSYCDDVTVSNVEVRGSLTGGENGFYGFYARGLTVRGLKLIDSYKGAVSLDSCVDVDLDVVVNEANRQAVNATNLITVANQTGFCTLRAKLKQSATTFTHGVALANAGPVWLEVDSKGVTATQLGQITSVGGGSTILNSTVTNATTAGNITLTPGIDAEGQWFNTPLTADINITLSTARAHNRTRWKIVRAAGATGAFNINVNGKALAVSQQAEIGYAPASGAYRTLESGAV